jgi:hypothetical protein
MDKEVGRIGQSAFSMYVTLFQTRDVQLVHIS